jgi:hypothetical protein
MGIADSVPGCEAKGELERNRWIIGVVNACPYIAIAVFCAWISGKLGRVHPRFWGTGLIATDPVNELCGRRGTIFIAAIFSLLAPLGMCLSQK